MAGANAHGEAYMLMTYRCDGMAGGLAAAAGRERRGCGASEVVWNSRDGVTPFMIGCRHCGGEAKHVDWQGDVYAPNHQPELGDRIFVDLDPELALPNRRDYVLEWWDHPDAPMREHPMLGPLGIEGAAARLAEADVQQYGGGTPHLIEVTDAVLDWLIRRGSIQRGGGR